jgi:hypothetical protein
MVSRLRANLLLLLLHHRRRHCHWLLQAAHVLLPLLPPLLVARIAA